MGVFAGILMVPISLGVLGWNEYRTIHRTQGIKQGAKVVKSLADTSSIKSELDKQLVHMTGLADTEEILRDAEFPVEEKAIKLRRSVEMFQWVEETSTKSRKKLGGGKETVTTFSYDKEWAEGRNNSENFEESSRHVNPPLKFNSQTSTAKQVTLGAFELNDTLVNSISNYQSVSLPDEFIESLDEELKPRVKVSGEYLYWSATEEAPNLELPNVGDLRIRFAVVKPAEVSLVAQQTGNTFAPFEVPNGETLQRLYVGKMSAEEMFTKFQEENMVLAWVLRVVGIGACCLGFFLIVSPLAVFADIVPFLGSITRGLAGMLAVLMGVCLSFGTIAISWIAVRPLIGIPLLLISIGSLVMLYRLISSRKKTVAPEEDIPVVSLAE
jgi:hypothetical protein